MTYPRKFGMQLLLQTEA